MKWLVSGNNDSGYIIKNGATGQFLAAADGKVIVSDEPSMWSFMDEYRYGGIAFVTYTGVVVDLY